MGDPQDAESTGGANVVLVQNGWGIVLYPSLLDQLERLISAAEAERARRGSNDPAGPNMKTAAAVRHLILHQIPHHPTRSIYRQGNTLGRESRQWMRAKFGNGRFRLFFRYHVRARLIVFAWVNDSETLRTYGSRTDAHTVFRRMLQADTPPDDWDDLVAASSKPDVLRRARKAGEEPPEGGRKK